MPKGHKTPPEPEVLTLTTRKLTDAERGHLTSVFAHSTRAKVIEVLELAGMRSVPNRVGSNTAYQLHELRAALCTAGHDRCAEYLELLFRTKEGREQAENVQETRSERRSGGSSGLASLAASEA